MWKIKERFVLTYNLLVQLTWWYNYYTYKEIQISVLCLGFHKFLFFSFLIANLGIGLTRFWNVVAKEVGRRKVKRGPKSLIGGDTGVMVAWKKRLRRDVE